MFSNRIFASIFAMGLIAFAVGAAASQTASTGSGQTYPDKPIRMVTGEPGGATDLATRVVAQAISRALGQPVVVDNRVGAVISGETVARASPDGYTLLVNANNFWIGILFQKAPYDPVKDFQPVTLVNSAPLLLAVHPSSPVKSVRELIALAKARPGELNYAMSAAGGTPHLSAELFKSMAGVNIVAVPYKGGGPAVIGLLGGQVQMMFSSAASVESHIRSGRLRGLAITSAQPSALFPGVPAVAETLPGYESASAYGIFAPAKTPAAIITRLNQEVVRALGRAEVKEKFLNLGSETVGNSPEQFAATIASDLARFGKMIKDAGIRN